MDNVSLKKKSVFLLESFLSPTKNNVIINNKRYQQILKIKIYIIRNNIFEKKNVTI